MTEQFKKALELSIEKMRAAKASIKQAALNAESTSHAFWQDAEKQLDKIEHKLEAAKAALNASTDEAILQAHLAAMDASEHWGKLKTTVDSALQQTSRTAKTEFDYTLLKAHLGKMDAMQFLEEDGKAFIEKFKHSREQFTKDVTSALKTMGQNMDKVANNLRRDV